MQNFLSKDLFGSPENEKINTNFLEFFFSLFRPPENRNLHLNGPNGTTQFN